ncbi:LytTR family DNA-binding domain-containing protein [Mucilaginibacter sp. PAMB04274]|uniref:LytR/AlgR family response regulator transcription factor n=1 Tax=Mucilaginibacter sp. PAMB04274 TaxID=3138568 RepID=UPI0031F605D2
MMRCVIIDDEAFSIEALRKYIELVPHLTIAGQYTNPQTALQELLHAEPFDLLFLDVDMPLISGIDLARVLGKQCRKLIFTTSHSKYAFDAFEVEAAAFLLKPFSFAKFSTTIAKLFPETENPLAASEYFLVKNKEEDLRIVKVKYADVIAFESLHNYVKIYLASEKSLTAYLSMKDILELVKGRKNFLQFHRAFVVATDHINYIEGNSVKMCNNLTFTVGERFKSVFSDYLGQKLITTARKK